MAFWEDAIGVGFGGWQFIYHRWIEDHPEAPPKSHDLVLPRVDEGATLPLVYGRCRVRAPVLVWSKNFLIPDEEYIKLNGAGTFIADHYSVDLLFVVGIPFNGGKATLSAIWAGDTPLTMQIDAATFQDTQSFRGGPGVIASEPNPHLLSVNGVFYRGSTTQNVDNGTPTNPDSPGGQFSDGVFYGQGASYDAALTFGGEDKSLVPGYRGQAVLFGHFAIGDSPSLPSFNFEITSLSVDTASDMGHSSSPDADPAAVIYDLLTSKWGKLAIPTDKIDLPSFQAASLTLFNENHGYSRAIEQGADGASLVADILRQIDGLLYEEPTMGKLVMKLVRNDYDVNDLDDVNPDNSTLSSYKVQGWAETLNQVRVTFTDRQNFYADGLAVGQNMANVIGQNGKLRALDITFAGCNDPELAKRLASRELAAVSKPVARATVVTNRTLYQKRPGDAVTWTYPDLGIDRMIMRIARIDFGQLHDGRITMDLIRDVFDVSTGAFGAG